MGRFMIRFSYFGTQYSGLQRQPKRLDSSRNPIVTVEGALQNALQHLFPVNDYKITLSSRTDKGVHSLRNACHVDLQHPEHGEEYNAEVITNVMNYHLRRHQHDIRVLETRRVSDEFHARFSAMERKYIYRIAHTPKENMPESEEEDFLPELLKYSHAHKKHPRYPFGENVVITDAKRIRAYRKSLDIAKLISAAEMLSGIHNYSSFTKRISQRAYNPHPVKLLTIGVKRGQPLGQHLYGSTQYQERNLEYWDVHVRAKSFLYRQIRRMVGAMVLVAKGVITLEGLQDVLENPRPDFPFASLLGMEECGLFLTDVIYKPEVLDFSPMNGETNLSSQPQTCGETFERDLGLDSASSGSETSSCNHRISDSNQEDFTSSKANGHERCESPKVLQNPGYESMRSRGNSESKNSAPES